ncbi:tRNA uracil 4-sulfurtransferase ThiI [Vagococcus fluvialis]|uniref:tRNA uracil 4-sulfurtransferase ThiI n=1 Tax=Vagococcus fluvialis TaxID=2738 RepID=UPI001A8D3DBF|nr:tRNA uracil 4-sulfurtransferase ThiI [Vagococcus fluvialis]MBO0437853.1 tRNA 4-thiouridine(8) synthase ThiI [Vagococcus fluvialis]UDM78872.1 tRNA 4-thiouridine(8) synthase ThiI [Vagococcus fluvialis]
MNYTEIMVRYGELSTKGKNRRIFISQLAHNVKKSLHEFEEVKIHSDRDRMHLELNGADSEKVMSRLSSIFGIQSFSPVIKIEKDTDLICNTAVEMVKEIWEEGQTYKVQSRRSDKQFVWDSTDMNREVGAAIYHGIPGIEVKMIKPDIRVDVEVRREAAYLSCRTLQGSGGLPVGSSGKGMLMLSGGIDSPVAGYLAMKRGLEIEAVHFFSPPYTSEKALHKAKDLTVKLTPYVGSIKFITVPFTEIQEEIKASVPSGYWMTITRRFMLRLTDLIREKRYALAIINGESLGQVASQTMQSMVAINEVTTTPIIRPVVTMDKNEIIEIAETIDTFELAIQPFEDCCTIFAPPEPKTRPKLEKVLQYESRLDVEGMIERAMAGLVVEEIKSSDDFLNASTKEMDELF